MLALLLAGCARSDPVEAIGGDLSPPAPSIAAFTLEGPKILPPDGTDRRLYEDDGRALVRYTVRLAADAPAAGDAFVTYLLDGHVVETEAIRLAPGKERVYERGIPALDLGDTHRVEVRAGAARGIAEATVMAWPRPGEALQVGNVTLRIDYGLQSPDSSRVNVNVTMIRAMSDEPVRDFRVKLVCVADGALRLGDSQRAGLPEPGTTAGIDMDLPDCAQGEERYALEFKLDAPERTYMGRILLVEKGYVLRAS